MKPHYLYIVVLCCSVFYSYKTIAQSSPIRWNYKASRPSPNEALLTMTASLAPGWHLYTQHLKPGGPIPTRFFFEDTPAAKMKGVTEEKGKAITYYDTLYEMKISWYSEQVQFIQRMQMNKPDAHISGAVEYMICNEQTCVPHEEKFYMTIPTYTKP